MHYHYDTLRALLPSIEESVDNVNVNYREKPHLCQYTLIGTTKSGQPVQLARFEFCGSPNGLARFGNLWIMRYDHAVNSRVKEKVYAKRVQSGTGRCSGYGYHKASTVLESCLASAGVRLEGKKTKRHRTWFTARIAGGGEGGIDRSLRAIGEAMGFEPHRLSVI